MDQLKISSQYINKRCGLHLDEYQQLDPGGSNRLGIIDGKGKFIACHNHKHITRKEYNEIIPKIKEAISNYNWYYIDQIVAFILFSIIYNFRISLNKK